MSLRRNIALLAGLGWAVVASGVYLSSTQESPDFLRDMQFRAVDSERADWAHWGDRPGTYSGYTSHSNRLIPVFTFGMNLNSVKGENSPYRDAEKLKTLYGRVPIDTLNPAAEYFDQTDIYRLQQQAFASGKKNVILMVFDGTDYQTVQAAAIYKNKKVVYTQGRGTGISFLDYGVNDDNIETDYGFCVTSPYNNDPSKDVDAQIVTPGDDGHGGGYSAELGGATPWSTPGSPAYLIGQAKNVPHLVTDSAGSATSLCSGIKTYNAAINRGPNGEILETVGLQQQRSGRSVGVVTSVTISHATPACAYAQNVTRNDYQDITRDLLGLKSISNRESPLPGVDVLIGCGWGESSDDDRNGQGQNYVPGNKYLTEKDRNAVNIENGGKYVVAERTSGRSGSDVLDAAVKQAKVNKARLFGFFGVAGGHLPYQTADGRFDPTRGVSKADRYEPADVIENPTLAEMTSAALELLQANDQGFWLMVEAGDVDWANHNNNLDDSIGAVLSGEAAFDEITNWVEKNSSWDETALILTSDHGHLLFVDDFEALTGGRTGVRTSKGSPDKRTEKTTTSASVTLETSQSNTGDDFKQGNGRYIVGPEYSVDPDLTEQGNPQGKLFEFTMPLADSEIFRGDDATLDKKKPVRTERKISVYIPAAYTDGTEAPILVMHDGPSRLNLIRNALDNLTISEDPDRRLPAFIAIAVENGGDDSKGSQRGLEYDTMSDRLARFINEEVLPTVLNQPEIKAEYPNLAFTEDPWGKAVMGCSSGGAAALTMGWFRPDLFRRLITYSGTFVDQQDDDAPEEADYPLGAWEYHSSMKLIENEDRKPLRIFTHVSENDLRPNDPEATHHNWVMANERTAAALEAKGYDYRFVFSKSSGHCDGKVFEQTLADTLVWMWQGYAR